MLTSALANDYSKVNVVPNHISFLVHFTAHDSKIQEYKIGLSSKEFVLGPRPGTAVEDQIFYSRAPLPTKNHLELIEWVEKKIIDEST